MSFEKLYYKGREVKLVDVGQESTVYVDHIYRTNSLLPDEPVRVHSCLLHGWFCWRNLFERPQDLLPFLRGKMLKLKHAVK